MSSTKAIELTPTWDLEQLAQACGMSEEHLNTKSEFLHNKPYQQLSNDEAVQLVDHLLASQPRAVAIRGVVMRQLARHIAKTF